MKKKVKRPTTKSYVNSTGTVIKYREIDRCGFRFTKNVFNFSTSFIITNHWEWESKRNDDEKFVK